MRIVAISDTHLRHDKIKVPDGDVLVLAGDWLERDEVRLGGVDRWLGKLPHKHKVVIAGNHDFPLQDNPGIANKLTACTYLMDDSVEIDGVKFYGSPWQPVFFDWAFNLNRRELERAWARIPEDTDVLVTHGPPHGILDVSACGVRCGCEELTIRLKRVKPKLHIFGHIHEAYGWLEREGTLYVNASSCNLHYKPVNKPIVIDYNAQTGAVVYDESI